MLFNSIVFFVFFITFYIIYRIVKDKNIRIILITIASYIFYGFWNAPFVFLLLLSTVVDFFVGKKLFFIREQNKRIFLLSISLIMNLGLLFVFKYLDLFITTSYSVVNLLGLNYNPPLINIILPVGISFYTFQTLSYTIDIYRRKIDYEKNFLKFAAFVSFFPQLVAGPILRASNFLPQFNKNRTFSLQIFYQGFFLISIGLFKKVVIADNLAPYVERVYNNNFHVTFIDAWVATYAYAIQIFSDFSGYSDIAIGLALLLGFYIPDNFNSPYAALSFSDFWRRWHISLSTWLRDYLYIPLGGNRKGNIRTYVNLMLTMLLGGLWHGAAWSFVVWGGLHGIYLAIERALNLNNIKNLSFTHKLFRRFVIFHLVCITWVFFRSNFTRGFDIISSMLLFNTSNAVDVLGSSVSLPIFILLLISLAFQFYFADRKLMDFSKLHIKYSFQYAIILAILWISILAGGGNGGAFIYFQF